MTLEAIIHAREGETVTVAPGATVHEAVRLFAERRIGAVPIVEGGELRGILSERDVIYALAREGAALLDRPVEAVMTQPPVTGAPDMSILAALSLMTRRRFRHLPVVRDGRMVGFVSIGDLVKARIDRIEGEAEAMRAYIAS